MLIAIVASSRWIVRRFLRGGNLIPALTAGAIALIILITLELTVVLALRGLTFNEYLGSRDPIAFAVYLLMLAVFAGMPAIFSRLENSRQNER